MEMPSDKSPMQHLMQITYYPRRFLVCYPLSLFSLSLSLSLSLCVSLKSAVLTFSSMAVDVEEPAVFGHS